MAIPDAAKCSTVFGILMLSYRLIYLGDSQDVWGYFLVCLLSWQTVCLCVGEKRSDFDFYKIF